MRPARSRKVYEADGVRFERPGAPVLQIVERPTIAAWNAAAEEGSLDLGAHLAARRARTAAAFRDGRETRTRLRAQDKGQREEVRAVCEALREGGPAPIPLADLANTTRATFRILDSLRRREAVEVEPFGGVSA